MHFKSTRSEMEGDAEETGITNIYFVLVRLYFEVEHHATSKKKCQRAKVSSSYVLLHS